jgi:hypothetical protein
MTLTLHLSPELEQRLKQEAKRQGLSLDAYALQLLTQSLPPKINRQNSLLCSSRGLRKATQTSSGKLGST